MKFCLRLREVKCRMLIDFFFMIALIKKTTLYKKHRNFPITWGGVSRIKNFQIKNFQIFTIFKLSKFSCMGLFVILNYIYSQLCKLILVPNIHSKRDSYRDRQTQTNKHRKTRKKCLFAQMELNRQRQCKKETDRSNPTIC